MSPTDPFTVDDHPAVPDGHSSARAARIYLHGSDSRQREIADALSKLARTEMKDHRKGRAASGPRRRSGTLRARKGRAAS